LVFGIFENRKIKCGKINDRKINEKIKINKNK
jgi:hypothetical protein